MVLTALGCCKDWTDFYDEFHIEISLDNKDGR